MGPGHVQCNIRKLAEIMKGTVQYKDHAICGIQWGPLTSYTVEYHRTFTE